MNKPLVCICSITYNYEKFIAEAIEGFFLQKTNFDYEIIIADDCSTDDTSNIIYRYIPDSRNDDKIRCFFHPQNFCKINFIFAWQQSYVKY
ncbi:MAG: glycosyltransferase [Bacteroidales bacterium]|jgi:glycosyltransferase involved in cell wall biosynthesis